MTLILKICLVEILLIVIFIQLTKRRNKSNNNLSCNHSQNYIEIRYIKEETPFVTFMCNDCGYYDNGHVYGDTENWEGMIECRDGIKIESNE